jgi:hypothetical protein
MSGRLLLASVVAALLAVPAAAPAQAGADTFSLSFTTARAGAPTGFDLEAEFRPQRVIDRLTVAFPRGTRNLPGAVPRCRATDAQVEQEEVDISELCRASSRIGTGTGMAVFGEATTPLTFELVLFNWTRGRTLLDIRAGGTSAFVAFPEFDGSRLVIPLTLAPEIDARVTSIELSVRRAGTRRRPFLRTPAVCPRSGRLTSAIIAREFGAGSVTTRDRTPCRR